jgi:hypothetical protein
MTINLELIDELLADYKKPEDIIGENEFTTGICIVAKTQT